MASAATTAKIDDIVRCDVKGRIFFAEVRSEPFKPEGQKQYRVKIKPITHNISYREVGTREIKRLYRALAR